MPSIITQEPYEHNGGAFKRLCATRDSKARAEDLFHYVQDLSYAPGPIQPDLFKYLLPACLAAWQAHLLGQQDRKYGGFFEQFFPSLFRRKALDSILTNKEFRAVENFVRLVLLEMLGRETPLVATGRVPPLWIGALADFGVLFEVSSLWKESWNSESTGHAIGVLQYASLLMYQNSDNPILPKAQESPSDVVLLNGTLGAFPYGTSWRSENIEFLRSQLTLEYLESRFLKALGKLQAESHGAQCDKLAEDWIANKQLVQSRIQQLPELFSDLDLCKWRAD